jgi:hypothetical protein
MTTKLRITQKGRDVRRVAASLTAYALIGCITAAGLWWLIVGSYGIWTEVTGG